MKKFLSVISVCLISLFSFAGCGIKGGSSAEGIEFVQDVFYVDYNISTFLDYKVYPLTASSNVYVNYDIENDFSLDSYFDFSKGSVRILNEKFTSIKVTAKLNEYSDTCEVRLKQYPTAVSFNKTTDYINAGGIYPLDLKGVFGEEILSCKDRQYIFKLTSSNPSIIEILSEEDLVVRSTGRKGEARIDVQICDSLNQEKSGLKASITLQVLNNIADAFITLDNLILQNDDIVDLSLSSGDEKRLNVLYFSEDNFVNDLTDYAVYLTNDGVFELLEDEGGYYLKLKVLEPLEEGKYYSVNLIIQSTAVNTSGDPYLVRCQIRVRIL